MGQEYDWSQLPSNNPSSGYDWSQLPSNQPREPQSWLDWGIENTLRTAPPIIGGFLGGMAGIPALGIGAIGGGALGAATGAGIGQWAGDLYADRESTPLQYAVNMGASAVPGFLGASKALTPGMRALGNLGRGSLEGAVTNLASTPFEEYADTGNWRPTNERMMGSIASGVALGGPIGAGTGHFFPPNTPAVESAPPPAVEAAPPPWDAGIGTKKYYEATPAPIYGPELSPSPWDMGAGPAYGTREGQLDLGLNDPTQGQLGLGPYRAPSGRMTNTGPSMPPRMGPPVGEVPPQMGIPPPTPQQVPFDFNQGDLFGGNPPSGVPPLSREDMMRQGWTKSPSGGLIAPNTPPPPPNEPPAGGGNAPIVAPPVTPPVTQAQGWQPVISNEGQVATLPPGYGANDVAMLRQQGFIPIQGMRSPDGYIMMFKGDAAVKAAISQRRGNRPAAPTQPVARPDVPGAIGPGMVAGSDVVPIPNEKASNLGFVKNMEAGGYVVSHKDATTTYFVKAQEEPAFQRVDAPGMDPRMAARVESQPGPRVFDASQPPPEQGQLMPMEVANQQPGLSDQDMLKLRAQQVLGENWGGNEPVQQSMIPMFQDAEASELMRRMGIDTSGRHGMPRGEEGPSHQRVPRQMPEYDPNRDYKESHEHRPSDPPEIMMLREELNALQDRPEGTVWSKEELRRVIEIEDELFDFDYPEGPAHARVPGGGYKASMNTERGIENITRDYTSPLSAVMSREGLQNAMDAAEVLGGDGVVKIRLNTTNKTIEIYDNGKGMDDATIGDKLFEAFSSGKEGEEGATGGKGIGSAAYIYGGKQFQLETVAVDGTDGVKYRIETSGTPKQFMLGQRETFSRVPVPDSTPTGTTIKIVIKDDHSIYDAQRMVNKIREHSRNRSSRLVIDEYGDTSGTPLSEVEHKVHPVYGAIDNITDSRFTSSNDDKMIGDFTTTNRNSQVKVLIPNGPIVESRSITVHYLNNGMYQFSDEIPLGSKAEVPKKVLVDIHPLTDDLDELYPFINTREDVKKDIREEVTDFVTKNIGAPAVSRRKNRTQELYDKMSGHGVIIPGTKRNPIVFDSGDRLTPDEKASFTRNPAVKQLVTLFDKIQDSILTAVGKGSWSDRLEGVGIFLDPKSYGIHIPNPTTKKSSILVNPFIRIEKGESPKDVAWHTTITNLHEAAHIGTEGGEPIQLTPQDMADPRLGEWFQSYINELTQHGDIGYENTGHGVAYSHRLGEVYAQFGVARTFNAAAEIQHILTGGSESGGYSSEIQRALQLYTDSRGRDAVTEDLLSRTGVKSKDRGRVRPEDIPGDTEAVGDGAAAEVDTHFNQKNDHPAVAKLRGLPKANEGDFNNTYFILPDGSRHSIGSNMTHNLGAQTVGTDLTESLGAGVVRFAGNGAEVGGRITYAQAEQLKRALDLDSSPYGQVGEQWIDVRRPSGEMVSKRFTSKNSTEAIRNWVNSHYVAEDVPRFSRVQPKGEMPPTPPGKEANDASTWRRLKESAGWGQGVAGQHKKSEVNWVDEVLALPSAATTTLDFSAPGRQGLTMIATKEFWKAAGAMFKGLSKEGFDRIDADLRSKPLFQRRIDMETGTVGKSVAEEIGMKLFSPASRTGPRAESVASRWLETGGNIPYLSKGYSKTIGAAVRMTNRAFITFLNHLNANRTEFLMNKARDMAIQALDTGSARPGIFKQKFSQSEAMDLNPYHNLQLGKDIADFVNTATGHGPLKTHLAPWKQAEVSLEGAASKLGRVLFSPGLLASRIRMLNPNTYIMAPPFVRKQYVKAALSTAAAWAATTELAKMAGAEVSDEETSADYGKIRIGDTRIDPGGGFLQFAVLYNRFYQGGYTSSATGEFHRFGEGFQAETQLSNLMRFGSNKLNPVAKFAYDVMNASEYNPFHVKDRTAQLFVPLFVQDVIGVVGENPELAPWLAPMALGVGAQTYSKGESVGKIIAPENDWLATGGGFADLGPDYIHPKLDY